jgi:lauroyl/myristoyl acyltransferase
MEQVFILTAYDYPDMTIVDVFSTLERAIEEKIKLEPANYLWSHRRFKYEYDAAKHAALLVS